MQLPYSEKLNIGKLSRIYIETFRKIGKIDIYIEIENQSFQGIVD